MPRILGLLGLLILCASLPLDRADSAARTSLWTGLAPGTYSIGYRRLVDSTLTVHVWYPARAGGEPLTFGAYLDTDSVSTRAFLTSVGIASPTVDRLLATRLIATASPEPESRVVPLILVAQGNGQDASDQVVLCEYLASQGYVVATTPSPMRRTPMEREDQLAEFAETQAFELASATSRVAAILPVDTTRVGVIGHSFGARAGLLLAMRNPHIRALVSLDGGIGTATAVDAFRSAPSFRANATLPPVLHFYERLDPFMKPDFTLLKSLHTGGLALRPTRGMHHTHFTTYGFAAALFPDIARVTHATQETDRSVVAVASETLAFLNRALR